MPPLLNQKLSAFVKIQFSRLCLSVNRVTSPPKLILQNRRTMWCTCSGVKCSHWVSCGPDRYFHHLSSPVCFAPCRWVPLLWNSFWFPWQRHCIHQVPWADTGPPLHQNWHFRTLLAQWLVMFLFCLFWFCFWKSKEFIIMHSDGFGES